MNKRSHFFIVLALMIETIIILYIALSKVSTSYIPEHTNTNEERTVDSVNAVVISKSMFIGSTSTYGRIKSVNSSTIKIPNYGVSNVYVESIQFNPGSYVNKGDILIQLKCEEIQYKLEASIKELARAKNQFERMEKSRSNISDNEYNQSLIEMEKRQAEMRALKSNYDALTIRAPFSGKVGIPSIVVGEQAHPNTILTTIVDTKKLNVEFYLDYDKSKHIEIGSSIDLESTDRLHTSDASVIGINPFIDENTNKIKVVARINSNHSSKFIHQLGVDVHISHLPWNNVYIVPFSAIFQDGNQYFVCKAESSSNNYIVRAARVRLVEQKDTQCAIVSDALFDGDLIITEGRFTKEGQIVEIQHRFTW